MKELLITPAELLKYMQQDKYELFCKWIRKQLDSNEPIWIIAQILEDKDTF